jgi:hypothetical protein
MTTLTATPDIATASVLLSITKTETVSRIERTDINGTHEVRVPSLTLPSTGAGTLHLTDYEAAHGVNNYRVIHSGSSEVATAPAVLALVQPWVFVPVLPNKSLSVPQITTYNASRTSSTIRHRVIDRTEPVVNMGKLGLREGQMDIWCPDYLATRDLDEALNTGEILMLRQEVPGMDMWFSPSEVDVQPFSEQGNQTRYRYTVRFQETLRPEGFLKGARGWTFDELAESFITFDQVTAAYASFDDLLIGKEK